MQPDLRIYLSQLDSDEKDKGIWVNPRDIAEWGIGEYQGRILGEYRDWKYLGCLEELSFGRQETDAALCHLLGIDAPRTLLEGYRTGNVLVQPLGIYEAWHDDRLDQEFREWLADEIEEIELDWARDAANAYVDRLEEKLNSTTIKI